MSYWIEEIFITFDTLKNSHMQGDLENKVRSCVRALILSSHGKDIEHDPFANALLELHVSINNLLQLESEKPTSLLAIANAKNRIRIKIKNIETMISPRLSTESDATICKQNMDYFSRLVDKLLTCYPQTAQNDIVSILEQKVLKKDTK